MTPSRSSGTRGADGLNGSGRSPADSTAGRRESGPQSVTVPGAVRLWADLAEHFGRFGLDGAVAPAPRCAATASCARRGSRTSGRWRTAPLAGARPSGALRAARARGHAAADRDGGPGCLYEGEVAAAIAAACWLSEDDLAAHASEWVEPLRRSYRGVDVCELPPNGQGVAALLALALYDGLEPARTTKIEAMELAFVDAYAFVQTARCRPNSSTRSVSPPAARSCAGCSLDLSPGGGRAAAPPISASSTATGWRSRSSRASTSSFGSGVVAPGTGVVLQNRGAGFSRIPGHPNELAPAKRPFHTIIPGMLLQHGELLGPFGVMGGPMQPQGHFQVVRRVVDDAFDPQAALDAPRWRVEEDGIVELEPGLRAPPARAARASATTRASVRCSIRSGSVR